MKIGVTGGKGGTGKSTIATALAFELAKKNKVLLVDADVDCPDDHLLLSIKRKKVKIVYQRIPVWDFKKCIKCGQCGLVCKTNAIVSIKDRQPIFMQQQCNGCGACAIKCPVKAISWDKKDIGYLYEGKGFGIDFISGELKINEPVSEFVVDALKDLVKSKEENYDYVIIDTAAGTHCDVISALEGCDVALAVTEPTPLGAHDLELILKLLKILKIKTKVVNNRSDIGDKNLIKQLTKKYKIEVTAEIPYSKKVIKLYSRGKPIQEKNILKIVKEVLK
ncbi:ATP-binding protein [Candidatus Woesearchaeota archaeon]|nr:ATP-binding protein [Candidatus Woesearchaeota archaeon]